MKFHKSEKLKSKLFGPITVTKIVGENMVKLDFLRNIKTHLVNNVSPTVPFIEQQQDFEPSVAETQALVPTIEKEGHDFNDILSPWKEGREFQFPAFTKGYSHHEAVWKPTKDIVDNDRTVIEAWKTFI